MHIILQGTINIQLDGVSDKSYSNVCTPNPAVGNLSLAVQTFGEFYCSHDYVTEREQMPQHLLIYTLAGKGKLKYRKKEYSLTPGTLMLIDCNEYQYYATDGDYWNFMYVHFTGSAATELSALVTHGENYSIEICDKENFLNTLSALVKSGRRDLPYEIIEASHILEKLFLQALKKQNQKNDYKKAYAPVQSAIDYIAEHYAEKLSLETLAKLTYLSKYHFLRIFNKITGMTPMEYIQAYRIGRAQIFLKTTDFSVEEISAKTGYENAAAFIRAFKKQTGTTPGKYKAQ